MPFYKNKDFQNHSKFWGQNRTNRSKQTWLNVSCFVLAALSHSYRDVNKDLTPKDKDLTPKDKDLKYVLKDEDKDHG